MKEGMIGIVGGMGPIAGIDLAEKIVNNTNASKDQDHISQILYSASELIGDRTEYLLGIIKENPAFAISRIILSLETIGATVVGLPCNSAHADGIFDVIRAELKNANSRIKLLHMIEEVGLFISTQYPSFHNIGILGTSGTYRTKQYNLIEKFNFSVINLSEPEIEEVHQAIYHPEYGIKSATDCISKKTKEILVNACNSLVQLGAEIIVLGCTELPLAFNESKFKNIPLIDSNTVLARALIREINPSKLKAW